MLSSQTNCPPVRRRHEIKLERLRGGNRMNYCNNDAHRLLFDDPVMIVNFYRHAITNIREFIYHYADWLCVKERKRTRSLGLRARGNERAE